MSDETPSDLHAIADRIQRLRMDLERNMDESANWIAETNRILDKLDELNRRRSALQAESERVGHRRP